MGQRVSSACRGLCGEAWRSGSRSCRRRPLLEVPAWGERRCCAAAADASAGPAPRSRGNSSATAQLVPGWTLPMAAARGAIISSRAERSRGGGEAGNRCRCCRRALPPLEATTGTNSVNERRQDRSSRIDGILLRNCRDALGSAFLWAGLMPRRHKEGNQENRWPARRFSPSNFFRSNQSISFAELAATGALQDTRRGAPVPSAVVPRSVHFRQCDTSDSLEALSHICSRLR